MMTHVRGKKRRERGRRWRRGEDKRRRRGREGRRGGEVGIGEKIRMEERMENKGRKRKGREWRGR